MAGTRVKLVVVVCSTGYNADVEVSCDRAERLAIFNAVAAALSEIW